MTRAKANADQPAIGTDVLAGSAVGTAGASDEAKVTEAQPAYAPYQELLTSWWTTAALAWGTPVKMWSEIVAAAWRPFLPPTALTAEYRPPESFPGDPAGRAGAPIPARPAPVATNRTPRAVAPIRPVPGTPRRPR